MIHEAKRKLTRRKGFQTLNLKQMLWRLPIDLAQVKAGNKSESLLNEIRQIVHSLYQSKEITEKVYSTVIKSKAASKAAIQKIAEANGDLVGNKSADKITSVSKIFSQNTVESELEISKERYILPAKRLQIIHELNLLW